MLRIASAELGYPYFYETHTRVDGILIGVMLAMLYHYVPDTFHRMQEKRLMWMAGIVVAILIFRHSTYPLLGALNIDAANLFGVSLLMLLYHHRPGGRPRPMLYRFIAWIGLYSYGIYLWHVSLIAPIIAIGKRMPATAGRIWDGIAFYILAVVIGVVTTKLIEFPTLRLRDKLFPRRVDSPVGVPAKLE